MHTGDRTEPSDGICILDATGDRIAEVPSDEPAQQLREARGGAAIERRIEEALVPAVRARCPDSVSPSRAQHRQEIRSRIGDSLQLGVEWRYGTPLPSAVRFLHFLEAWPILRRRKPQIRERAPDRRCLRVLETGHRIDVAIPDPLARPPRCGR